MGWAEGDSSQKILKSYSDFFPLFFFFLHQPLQKFIFCRSVNSLSAPGNRVEQSSKFPLPYIKQCHFIAPSAGVKVARPLWRLSRSPDMLTDRQETALMYIVISSRDARRCPWECIYAETQVKRFFFFLLTEDNQMKPPPYYIHTYTHTHTECLLLSSPSLLCSLFNASANSVQPGRWGWRCPLSVCPSCGTCYHSLFPVLFSVLTRLNPPYPLHRHEHKPRLSTVKNTIPPKGTPWNPTHLVDPTLSSQEKKEIVNACSSPQPLTHPSNSTRHHPSQQQH